LQTTPEVVRGTADRVPCHVRRGEADNVSLFGCGYGIADIGARLRNEAAEGNLAQGEGAIVGFGDKLKILVLRINGASIDELVKMVENSSCLRAVANSGVEDKKVVSKQAWMLSRSLLSLGYPFELRKCLSWAALGVVSQMSNLGRRP